MTCPACEPFYAITKTQLANRLKNLSSGGSIYPCQRCGSIDWATSTRNIGKQLPSNQRRNLNLYYYGITMCVITLIIVAATLGYLWFD
jgi:Zn-finger protein